MRFFLFRCMLLVLIMYCNSCEPEEILVSKPALNETVVSKCCGEQGHIPIEPEEEQEEEEEE